METYLLDLTTLLQILARQKQSGVLQAEDVRLPGSRQATRAYLVLVQGKIESCTLFPKTGTGIIAEGATALHILYELGALEWRWTPNLPHIALTEEQRTAPSTGRLPRRTAYAETAAFTLPRNHKRVLALIDGKRPIDKIASVLAFTNRHELLKVLSELHAWGLIVWDE